jgi:hypothetical protein
VSGLDIGECILDLPSEGRDSGAYGVSEGFGLGDHQLGLEGHDGGHPGADRELAEAGRAFRFSESGSGNALVIVGDGAPP